MLVSRIGGDEFAVLTQISLHEAGVQALADTIVHAIRNPVDCAGQMLTIGASVGIAHMAAGTPDELFRHADAALYAAKGAGRNTSRAYQSAQS